MALLSAVLRLPAVVVVPQRASATLPVAAAVSVAPTVVVVGAALAVPVLAVPAAVLPGVPVPVAVLLVVLVLLAPLAVPLLLVLPVLVMMLPRSPAVLPFSQVSRVHHDAVSPAASAATGRSCCSPWSGARHLRVVVGALELVGAPPGAKLPRVAAPSWAPLVLVRLLRQGPVPATLPMALELLPDVVDRLAEVHLQTHEGPQRQQR